MKRLLLTAAAIGSLAGLCAGAAPEPPQASPPPHRSTHKEVANIAAEGEAKIGELATLCVTADDRLLACDAKANEVKVFGLTGKVQATWKLPFAPSAICACPDGTVYVGGVGKLAKLDRDGKVAAQIDVGGELTEQQLPGPAKARTANSWRGRKLPDRKISGLAATDKELFASIGTGWSLRSLGMILRFDRNLGGGTKIADGLRGCCQRLDLAVKDGVLYVAENTRYRILTFDREGKSLGSWGRRDRTVEGFGSCCNPMNVCFGPGGELYTAESGLGRIKRYTADGRFLALIGEVGVTRFERAGHLAASCSNIAVAVSKDGRYVFVQDVKTDAIRVLERQ